jgi:hypothetical protein
MIIYQLNTKNIISPMQRSVIISSPIRQTTYTTNYPAGTTITYSSPVRTYVSPVRTYISPVRTVISPARVVTVSSPVVTSYVSPIRTRVYHPATVTTTTVTETPAPAENNNNVNFVPEDVNFTTPNPTER